MAGMTREQYKEIRKLTRAAQRRMERASPGQRRAMEYQVKKSTGAPKWSSATKGFTYQQAQAQIQKLKRFMEAESTTIRGWRSLKEEQVAKAKRTLEDRYKGFDLTDEELAEIFIQAGEKSKSEKYKAINLVQAAKTKAGDAWTGSKSEIEKAVGEKVTAEAAYRRALRARKENIERGYENDQILF